MSKQIILSAEESAKLANRARLAVAKRDYSHDLLQQRSQAKTTKERRTITAALFDVLPKENARRLLKGSRK